MPQLVKLACVIHAIGTLFMLTDPSLMPPSDPFREREEFADNRILTPLIYIERINRRLLSRPYVAAYDIFVTVGLILMVAHEIVLPPFYDLFAYLISYCKTNRESAKIEPNINGKKTISKDILIHI